MRTTNGNASRLSIAELHEKKANLEEELKALSGILDSHGVNMDTPLLTQDGFPRADIDVAQSECGGETFLMPAADHCGLESQDDKSSHYMSKK